MCGKNWKIAFYVFLAYFWYGLIFTNIRKVKGKLKKNSNTFIWQDLRFFCPKDRLAISDKITCQIPNFICQTLEKSLQFVDQTYKLRKRICFQVFHRIWFFWPKNELVIFSWILQIWGGTLFSNICHQYCVCPSAPLLIFFIQNPLEVNYFKRRAIRNYCFILNCTGNARLMADFCPWDSRGGVMENKVWDRTKPKMGIYTMSDTDITWPENLLWIYLLQKK